MGCFLASLYVKITRACNSWCNIRYNGIFTFEVFASMNIDYIYKKVYPKLIMYCASFGIQKSDAENLVQDIIINFSKEGKGEDHDDKQIISYLRIATRGAACRFLKQQRKYNQVFTSLTLDFADLKDSFGIDPKTFKILLRLCSESNYPIMEGFYLKSISIKDLAKEFKSTESNIKKKLYRGRKEIVESFSILKNLIISDGI